MNVLLADDSMLVRDILSKHLKKLGAIRIDNAASGEEAINKVDESVLKKRFYDLAMLDINMPGKDGLSVLRHIKKVSEKTKVIIGSSVTDTEIKKQAKKDGAVAYFVKPFDMEQLVTFLRGIFSERGVQAINILVADDSDLTRSILRRYFLHFATNVTNYDEAEDGQKAIEMINARKYDLAVLDVNMPKANGIRVLQHIRTELGEEARVIICSTTNDVATIKRIKELNADAYLLKPVDVDRLDECMLKFFPMFRKKIDN